MLVERPPRGRLPRAADAGPPVRPLRRGVRARGRVPDGRGGGTAGRGVAGVTRDHALLAVELATRLGTTPALRAAFAPVVWRARAALKGDAAGAAQASVVNSTGLRKENAP